METYKRVAQPNSVSKRQRLICLQPLERLEIKELEEILLQLMQNTVSLVLGLGVSPTVILVLKLILVCIERLERIFEVTHDDVTPRRPRNTLEKRFLTIDDASNAFNTRSEFVTTFGMKPNAIR